MNKDILTELNNSQRQAVKCLNGPMMVIAGAGSGKTRVLTYRIAYLLNEGVDPFNVLALTFTNKAAREMKQRIADLVQSSDARNVWMGTFHSVFAKILRIEGHLLGYPSNYTIYDTDDSKSLLKIILKEKELDIKEYPPNQVLNRISFAKMELMTPAAYLADNELFNSDKAAKKPLIGEIYETYQSRLMSSSAMDFDDLLFNMHKLLIKFPEVLYKYQQKFTHILVDEYQDTNHAQYMIVKKLAAKHENICVVGDDAQSIYSFRGANIQNILSFKKDYPDLKIYKLEQNYRSTKTIVEAANSVIKNNKEQIFKKVWTDNNDGGLIKLIKATTDSEEGRRIADSIFHLKMTEHAKNGDFAILYRTNAQSRSFEDALRKLNITYRIYGGLSFYKRKEVKDLLAYLRLVVNPNDEEALSRVINYPSRGIGLTSMNKIRIHASKTGKTIWETIEKTPDSQIPVSSATQNKISHFVNMINSFHVQLETKNAYSIASEVAKFSGLIKNLSEDQTPEGISRMENIEELLNAINEFVETPINDEGQTDGELRFRPLSEFMQEVSLLTDADTKDKENADHVSLMTIHAAKGLEFPYVHIVGLEENLFPSIQSLSSRQDLEEERRLFYVALTRAMKSATISYAENRYRWGTLSSAEPSRFIEEIDPKFLEIPAKSSIRKNSLIKNNKRQVASQTNNPNNLKKISTLAQKSYSDTNQGDIASPEEIQNGMEVTHSRFGDGKVLKVEGQGPNKKAHVFFHSVGQKQLLLRFAKLKIKRI